MPFAWLALIVSLATTNPASGSDALRSMVEAERAFSRMSVERGMRDAFVTNLADDAIVFNPLPANGKQVWEPRPRSTSTLIWEPDLAEVAAAGDLGFTSGPWELRPPENRKDRPTLHGHFHTVWRRAQDGPWKVAVDIGGGHEALEPGVGSGALRVGPGHAAGTKRDRSRAAAREILAADERFSRQAKRDGFAVAFAAAAAADVRLSRDGHPPAEGVAAARSRLGADVARARWKPQGSGASRSGDLGYTYGIRERLSAAGAPPDTSVFMDVWRREGSRWKLALAVDNPVTRP